MKIVRVTPIARGIPRESLTYFYREEIPSGALVSIPLRNKVRMALVIECKDAGTEKALIKKSDFALKKIHNVVHEHFFRTELIAAANIVSDYYASSTGAILSLFLPESIIKHIDNILPSRGTSPLKTNPEKGLLTGIDEERFSYYKTLIRSEFAAKHSLLFILPTVQDVNRFKKELERGIEKYSHSLHSYKKPTEIKTTWNFLMEESHPVVIFATPKFMAIPRADISTIVVERENTPSYKLSTRPYVDSRHFAELYATEMKARFIRGDVVPSIETMYRAAEGELVELSSSKSRMNLKAKASIINMRESKLGPKRTFSTLSKELEQSIRKTQEENSHMAILAFRRGIAPQTVCGDCGAIVLCLHCSAPVVLHKSKTEAGKNLFVCHRCSAVRPTEERCRTCTSWKLVPLGVGIERVFDEIHEKFPALKLFRMDADSVKNQKQGEAMRKEFLETPGSIIVGTEIMLSFLDEPIERGAVASIDSLFVIPDYRINERIFSLLTRLRLLTKETLLIQTRNPEELILKYAVEADISSYYKKEITERKALLFPPFARFIKITLLGNLASAVSELQKIQAGIGRPMDIFQGFGETVRGKHIVHGLIRLTPKEWPDKPLLDYLRNLPPSFRIEVDPASLL